VQLGGGDDGLLCEGLGVTEISRGQFNYIMSNDFENILVRLSSSSSSSSSASPQFLIRSRVARACCSSCVSCTSKVRPRIISFGGRLATDPLHVRFGQGGKIIAPTWKKTAFVKNTLSILF